MTHHQDNGVTERKFAIESVSGSDRVGREDFLAVEEPMEIRVVFGPHDQRKDRGLSITMRTPGDDFDLAAGFLFTEGILTSGEEIEGFERCGPVDPSRGESNSLRVELQPDVNVDLSKLQRHFYTTSSCGVCGKVSLDAIRDLGVVKVPDSGARFSMDFIHRSGRLLRRNQVAFQKSGGVHAAGLFDEEGVFHAIREDVGRHNALDKLIGNGLRIGKVPFHGHGVMVSGRSSFELVQKTISAGAEILVAVGPPSSLAVEMAIEFNLTLVGFATGDRFNIYSGGFRVE